MHVVLVPYVVRAEYGTCIL